MKIIKPKKLSSGDLIGIISPSSSPDDLSKIDNSVKYLEKLGYKVEVGRNVGAVHGYFAGEDEKRLSDLHYMFKNKEVKAIFTIRGGYGSTRLLDKINYDLIRKNPKIFVGFSDITALQMAFFKKAGLVTFAGPMLAVNFYDEIDPGMEESFWDILTSNKKIRKLQNPDNEKIYVLNKGRGEGRLIGGSLTIITSLLGTEFAPDFRNKILILEEVCEPPYRIDRMFNQLRLAKTFKYVKGIILARFVDCYESDLQKSTLTLNQVIEDYFRGLSIPVLYNIKHGHIKQNLTVPLGINCKINGSRGFIEFTESAVR